jgi:outer membrane receptor protein involved in Fe transport
VVTATHKSESLQKVPISIQALSPETLSQHQVASVSDYANLLPSVSFSTLGPGRSEVFFRGISVDGGQMATAGVYLDDIPITSPGRNPIRTSMISSASRRSLARRARCLAPVRWRARCASSPTRPSWASLKRAMMPS